MFLDSLAGQVLPGACLEAVIADGLSDDGTRAIVERYATRFSWIRMVDNPGRIAATGLNLALRESTGEIVLRMDAHTEYAPDYVSECLAVLRETGARNVGGPARTKAGGYWQTSIALASHSFFFSGGARFRDVKFEGCVDTVPYGCWKRETLLALGGFDETLERNQDDELNFRIIEAGGKIWQSPRIRSWYFPRRSLRALANQYYRYGLWKAVVIRKHGRPAEWRQIVPMSVLALFLAVLSAAYFLPSLRIAAICGISSYGLTSVAASAAALRNRGQVRFLPALPLIFATVHLSYAIGMLQAAAQSLVAAPYSMRRKWRLSA